MITVIVIIYIFLSFVIFHQQLKITFRKSSGIPCPRQDPLPHFYSVSTKNLKSGSIEVFCVKQQ